MADEKGVESNPQNAPAEGVENNGSSAQGTENKVDWEKVAKDAIAREAQMTQERDNYKKGLLMAKGKLQDDGTADKLANDATDITKVVAEEVKKAVEPFAKQNEELKVALQNRSQVQSHTSGSSQESAQSSQSNQNFWSKEQIDYFKSKGLDPQKVYDNWQNKIKQ